MLGFPKEKTFRSEEYKDYIRSLPCCNPNCPKHGRLRSEAHHVDSGGGSIKGSDLSCIPLCCHCHVPGVHTMGHITFQQRNNVDFNEVQIKCLSSFIEKELSSVK